MEQELSLFVWYLKQTPEHYTPAAHKVNPDTNTNSESYLSRKYPGCHTEYSMWALWFLLITLQKQILSVALRMWCSLIRVYTYDVT